MIRSFFQKIPHGVSQASSERSATLSDNSRSLRKIIVAAASCLPLITASALTVTNTNDSGAGSLRQTIIDTPANGVVNFAPGLSGQTVTLSSEIVLTKALTVDASALKQGLIISGANSTRLLRINAAGNLTLRKLTFKNGNGTGAADSGFGGAIYNVGTATVQLCTFERNLGSNYGGAIYNGIASTLTVDRSTFTVNSTTLYGGAIANSGVFTLLASTFQGNTSTYQGGAIYTDFYGDFVARNTTFVNNTANYYGGAIFNGSESVLESVTVARNSAARVGGGIYNDYFGSLLVNHSILAQNVAPDSPEIFGVYNGTRNFIGGDPKLTDLGSWGGPTQSLMPYPDSPVIDAGSFTSLTTDQRGLARILGDAPDIGAIEVGATDYTESGLTLFARVPTIDTDGVFEISTDPDFLPFVSTFAGDGIDGFLDAERSVSQFGHPAAVAADSRGNIFFADTGNNRIRMTGPNGQVVTIAGTGVYGIANGAGPIAQFAFPSALVVGPDDNLYVADTFNHRICKITRPLEEGGLWTVSSIAGSAVGDSGFVNGSGTSARFLFPYGLDVDDSGTIYVADSGNNRIRKITAAGSVTTYAGGSTAGSTNSMNAAIARFDQPKGVVLVNDTIYVADSGNHRIRKIVRDGANAGEVSTFAGSTSGNVDGLGVAAQFRTPAALATDGNGTIFVADELNHSIRKITIAGEVTTVVGLGTSGFVNGDSTTAKFNSPTGIAVDPSGNLLIADTDNHVIRRVNIKPLSVPAILISGSGNASGVQVSAEIDLLALGLDPLKTYYFRWKSNTTGLTLPLGHSFFTYDFPVVITDPASDLIPTSARLNSTVDPKAGVTTLVFEYSTDPNMLPPFYVRSLSGSATPGFADGLPANAAFSQPNGMAVNAAGEVFVADRLNHRIRKVTPAGLTSTFAGSGDAGFVDDTGIAAQFENPNGLAFDSVGNLYVADEANHVIRKITPAGVVTTFAGSGIAGFAEGDAADARFLYPTGVAVDSANNVYVADSGNHRIRKVDAVTGVVTTHAGSGLAGYADGDFATAQFSTPIALAFGPTGNIIVVDRDNLRIRLIDAVGVSTLAGSGNAGSSDGLGAAADFDGPTGVAVDADGNAYITDTNNHRIRRVALDGLVTTVAGSGIAGTEDSPSAGLYPAIVTQFDSPMGIAINAAGGLYITQEGMVRTLARSATVPKLVVEPPPQGSGLRDVFADLLEPLLPGATYYFRAVGTNYRGTVRGDILSFTTPVSSISVFDGDSTAAPALSHGQVDVIDYGDTPTGQPVMRSFTVSNPGGWPLTISSISVPFGYHLVGGSGVIPPLNAVTFTLTLTAAAEGPYAGNVVINSDAPGEAVFEFPITGLVLDPPVVVTLDATDLGTGSATFNGTVNPKGSDTQVWFEWSRDPEFDGVDVTTFAGSTAGYTEGVGVLAQFNKPNAMVTDAAGNVYVADTLNHRIRKIAPDGTTSNYAGTGVAGFANGSGATAQFNEPTGLAISASGVLFVADCKNHRIRAISTSGEVTTYAGLGTAGFTNGIPTAARFRFPSGIAIDAAGILYVADTMNHRIRRIALDGFVSTFAGLSTSGTTNGNASVAKFNQPLGIALDTAGNAYVTEVTSHAIRKILPDGTTSLFAGSATTSGDSDGDAATARFTSPAGLTFASAGLLYVADAGNHVIRTVTLTGDSATYAGSGVNNTVDGNGDDASFSQPVSVALSADGVVYVAEKGSSVIRKIETQQTILDVPGTFTGTTPQNISLAATDLPTDQSYYIRIIATNGGGTSTGLSKSVTIVSFRQWQVNNFGAQANNSQISDPNACPSGDGIVNLVKYALGLDPNVSTSEGMPILSRDGSNLSLSYNKVACATNIVMAVEWSTDLVNWSTAGVTTTVLSDDGITQEIRSSVPAGTTSKFLRLSVTKP